LRPTCGSLTYYDLVLHPVLLAFGAVGVVLAQVADGFTKTVALRILIIGA